MANSVDPDETAPIGAVCSGSTLFASILNSSVMLGNYLQQTTSADDIFRCIFLLGTLRVKGKLTYIIYKSPVTLLEQFTGRELLTVTSRQLFCRVIVATTL